MLHKTRQQVPVIQRVKQRLLLHSFFKYFSDIAVASALNSSSHGPISSCRVASFSSPYSPVVHSTTRLTLHNFDVRYNET